MAVSAENKLDTEGKGHIVGYGLLVALWAIMLCLTGLNIWSAGIELGNLNIIIAMLIATTKAIIVLLIFMHLRYEPPVFKVMVGITVATLTAIILMTFTDVWFR